MRVQVRRAHPEEYARAGQIAADGYAADGLLTRADGTTDADYRGLILDGARRAEQAELLVAVHDEKLIGTVTWCPVGSPWRQVAQQDHQGEFRMLAVAPAGRGHGVGRALVEACLDRARTTGMTEVVMSSLPEMTTAHRLYRTLGFTRAPELDFTPVPLVHLWAFRLALHAP